MIVFFASFVCATLKRYEDPYQILGVPRTASQEEIKAKYHEITRKHHPDIAERPEESTPIWMAATDAYELLSNPKSRKEYDTTGNTRPEGFSEYSETSYYYKSNPSYKSRKGGGYYSNFEGEIPWRTQLWTIEDIDELMYEKKDLYVLFYSETDYLRSNPFGRHFERMAQKYQKFVPFVRISLQTGGAWFGNEAQLSYAPTIVYIVNDNGHYIYNQLMYTDDIEYMDEWFENIWNPKIEKLNSIDDINKWVNKDPVRTHVLRIDFKFNSPSYKRSSIDYPNLLFAGTTHNIKELVNMYNLTHVPGFVVFKNGIPLRLPKLSDLYHFQYDYMLPFSKLVFNDHKAFVVYCGEFSDKLHERYLDFDQVPLYTLSPSDPFAQSLGAHEGDFFYVDRKLNMTAKLKPDDVEDNRRLIVDEAYKDVNFEKFNFAFCPEYLYRVYRYKTIHFMKETIRITNRFVNALGEGTMQIIFLVMSIMPLLNLVSTLRTK